MYKVVITIQKLRNPSTNKYNFCQREKPKNHKVGDSKNKTKKEFYVKFL